MMELERIENQDVVEDVNNYEEKEVEVTEETEQVDEQVYLPEPQKKKSKAGLIFGGTVGAVAGVGLYHLVIRPKLQARKLRKAKELLEANGATVFMPEPEEVDTEYDVLDEDYESETEEETNE